MCCPSPHPQHGWPHVLDCLVFIDKDLSKLLDECPDLRKQHLFTCSVSQRASVSCLMRRLWGERRAQLPPTWGELGIVGADQTPETRGLRVAASPSCAGHLLIVAIFGSGSPPPSGGRTLLCVLSEGLTRKCPLWPWPSGRRELRQASQTISLPALPLQK